MAGQIQNDSLFVFIHKYTHAAIRTFCNNKFRLCNRSIVYAIGSIIVAVSTIPVFDAHQKATLYIGLALIALGSGGIKPCVAAFGGDQFKLPEQAVEMSKFFSKFYFAINAGSLLSTAITPNLRSKLNCFGEGDCYTLAFGVPAILMIVSISKMIFESMKTNFFIYYI